MRIFDLYIKNFWQAVVIFIARLIVCVYVVTLQQVENKNVALENRENILFTKYIVNVRKCVLCIVSFFELLGTKHFLYELFKAHMVNCNVNEAENHALSL